jgi:PKD repeat protein
VPGTTQDGHYVYQRPGTYRVTLVVWDNHGRGAVRERMITVEAPETRR